MRCKNSVAGTSTSLWLGNVCDVQFIDTVTAATGQMNVRVTWNCSSNYGLSLQCSVLFVPFCQLTSLKGGGGSMTQTFVTIHFTAFKLAPCVMRL
jgi:hypothetical protein